MWYNDCPGPFLMHNHGAVRWLGANVWSDQLFECNATVDGDLMFYAGVMLAVSCAGAVMTFDLLMN